MKRILSFVAAVAIAAVVSAPAPARADYLFTPANVDALAALFPDTCIPWGSSGVCITFTNAAYLTQLASARNSTAMGQMLAQGLQDGRLNSLAGDFGVVDTTGFDTNVRIAAMIAQNPTNPAYAAAQAWQASQAQNGQDVGNLYRAMQTNGAMSDLAQNQLNGTALLKVYSAIAASNNMAAAEQQQKAAVAQAAAAQVGSMLDLTNTDPTAGWNF